MQELVVESLVVPLAMVVFYVLVDETTQMPLAERDHACETLLFDRPDEPLGIGVEIGTLRRQPNRLHTGALQDLAKDPRIEGIAGVNQMARPAQTAIDRVGHIAGLLLHPRAARLRVDPGDGHAAGSQLDHEEDEVPPEPRQRQHLDGEQIAGRQALPVRLQERLPGHVPAPLGRRVDSVVVQDPLHRGPGDSVAEVRERAADPRVAPPRIVDRHPDHELGDVLSGHWSTSTSAGAAIVFRGDQSPVPTQDRVRGDDARDLRQDPPAEFVAAHSESTALGVRQAKRPRAQVFPEDPILLPEIVDQIVLVTVHPASEREDEELQRRRHSLRLLGRIDQHRPSLGRLNEPYGMVRGDTETIAFMQEWFGYCLVIDTSRQKFLMLEGPGANGKSVLLAILEGLVGRENCSSVSLEEFGERFALSATIGKLVNIVSEVGDVNRLPEGRLKAFVVGDPLTLDRKYRDALNVKPTARLVFATNKLPKFADKTNGIWRRVIIVPATVVIPPDRQDTGLTEKLRAELPGIFNWAVEGLVRLRRQDRFTEPSIVIKAVQSHRQSCDPIGDFLRSYLREDPTGQVTSEKLYGLYAAWCEEHDLRPDSESALGKAVKQVFPTVERKKRGPRRQRYWGYVGVSRVPGVPGVSTVSNLL